MPLPLNHAPVSPSTPATHTDFAAIDQAYNQILAGSGLNITIDQLRQQANTPTTGKPPRLKNPTNIFGAAVPQAAEEAARTREGCPAAFTDGVTPQIIRDNVVNRNGLLQQKQSLELTLGAVNKALNDSSVTMSGHALGTYREVKATLASKWAPVDLKTLLTTVSKPFLDLAKGRLGSRNNKRAATVGGKKTVTGLKNDNAKLQVTNKYLDGQELRPGDVILDQQAAKNGRRTTR